MAFRSMFHTEDPNESSFVILSETPQLVILSETQWSEESQRRRYITNRCDTITPPSGPIEPARSAAERGNAGKRPGRPDGGIRHRAVSSTVPPTYVIMLVSIKR